MKKLFSTIVISALLCVNTFATPVVVNSKPATFEKPVIIRQSTSFLSLREIASNLLDNVNLQWNVETKTATLTSNNITVQVPIGTNYIVVNDNTRPIDANNSQVTSFIENGTTYVPIRCIAESFGYDVNYSENTIYISNKGTQNSTLPQFSEMKQGETIATMHTSMGDITFRFFPQYAPKAVENFLTHAKEGYYNNIEFHRVINNFMIQGGDPTATGASGESIWNKPFENEVSLDLRNFRGALCMANAGPDTNGSQFYIVQNKNVGNMFDSIANAKNEIYYSKDGKQITVGQAFSDDVIELYKKYGGYPSLDMGYTVFGQVIDGMDIVDKIASTKTDDNNKPVEKVVIQSIDVTEYK